MGKFIVQQFVSADGFAANKSNEFDLFDRIEGDPADFDRSNLEWLSSVGAIVFGSTTYRMFADYWPTPASENEIIAPKLNSLPKFVFSTTLEAAPWGDFEAARIESGDAAEALTRLKREVDGHLIAWGSLALTADFFAKGLVDIVRIVVLPVILGGGRAAFPTSEEQTRLRLLNTSTFSAGLVELEYAVEG